MKLFLTSAYPAHRWLAGLKQCATQDRLGRHELALDPESADAILFVEEAHFDDYHFRALREHPLIRQFPRKCFMYNELDKPSSPLPGLYCSMPDVRYQADQHVAFPYLWTDSNPHVAEIHQWRVERCHLYSFVGSMSHRTRRKLMQLKDPRARLIDTSNFNVWDSDTAGRAQQSLLFAQTMASSEFVLCPRGIGTSSFRPFEAMQAARAPVILSDHWVPPPQVDWSFAVFVSERDWKSLPERLRALEGEAMERGQAARAAWQAAFSSEVLFDTVSESVVWLHEAAHHSSTRSSTVRLKLPRLLTRPLTV